MPAGTATPAVTPSWVQTTPVVTIMPQPDVTAPGTDTDKVPDTARVYTVGKGKYRFNGSDGVILTGTVSKLVKSFIIPASVKIDGRTYKVVGISKNAFKNCRKLKNITVKSLTIKKAGQSAFRNIHKRAVIRVPKSCLKRYRKLFRGRGQKSTVSIR